MLYEHVWSQVEREGIGVLRMKPAMLSSLWSEAGRCDRDTQVVGQDVLWPCQSTQGLPRFGLPLSSPVYVQHPLSVALGPRFGLVLMLAVAPVPHPTPAYSYLLLLFLIYGRHSSFKAVPLLCLSGWIKVSYIITLILEPIISPSPAPVLLHSSKLLL